MRKTNAKDDAYYLVLQFKKHRLFLPERFAKMMTQVFLKSYNIDLMDGKILVLQKAGEVKIGSFNNTMIKCRFNVRMSPISDAIYNYWQYLPSEVVSGVETNEKNR